MNIYGWRPIGPGVDDRLTELEDQLQRLIQAHRESDADLGRARGELRRLEAELAVAERDYSLAVAEGRRAKDPGKLAQEMEKTRSAIPQLIQRVQGRAAAVATKRDELERYVLGNLERLEDQHRQAGEAAQARVSDALDQLTAEVTYWNTVQRQTITLITKQQGRTGHEVPELPAEVNGLVTSPPDIPLPLPKPRPAVVQVAGWDLEEAA